MTQSVPATPEKVAAFPLSALSAEKSAFAPSSMITELSGIDPYKRVNSITARERRQLVGLLKDMELEVAGTGGFEEAVITKGGVSVKELDPKTFEVKRVKGLYFTGEVIDVDAHTGGFNLQIAWSSGYAAGSFA